MEQYLLTIFYIVDFTDFICIHKVLSRSTFFISKRYQASFLFFKFSTSLILMVIVYRSLNDWMYLIRSRYTHISRYTSLDGSNNWCIVDWTHALEIFIHIFYVVMEPTQTICILFYLTYAHNTNQSLIKGIRESIFFVLLFYLGLLLSLSLHLPASISCWNNYSSILPFLSCATRRIYNK